MARARNIKPGFYKNEDLAECSPWARLLFPGLWMLADREGRMEDRPKRIKGEIFPFDSIEVGPLLDELERWGFILRYKKDGASYLQILKFTTHQTPHYTEKESVIPAHDFLESRPDDDDDAPGGLQEDSRKALPIKMGSLPPDSLNPDSLNPDSLNPEPIPPPATAREGSFAMDLSWEPSQHFPTLARQAGVPAGGFTPESLAEFRSYWLSQPDTLRTQHEWDHALLRSLKAEKLRDGQKPRNGGGARASPINSAERLREHNRAEMAKAGAAIMAREKQHAGG
jgi:hypothetical protein